jgi:DNA-directed RNA polymerase specialized sigma24 family protein
MRAWVYPRDVERVAAWLFRVARNRIIDRSPKIKEIAFEAHPIADPPGVGAAGVNGARTAGVVPTACRGEIAAAPGRSRRRRLRSHRDQKRPKNAQQTDGGPGFKA